MYYSDNTNCMLGQPNSFLYKIQSVQGDKKIFDLGCPRKRETNNFL